MSDIELSADFSDIKQMNAELEQTLRAINPVANASLGFAKKLKVLDKALIDANISKKRYNVELANLRKQAQRAGVQLDTLDRVVGLNNKSTRQMELQFQQAGYQIQDFIVQVQGGVNPLIAFSQQGSQLAGFFAGPWGAAIGLGIASLSTLGMVLLSTRGEAEDFEENLDALSEAVQLYKGYSDTAAKSTQDLRDEFGASATAAGQVAEFMAEWAKVDAVDKINESVNSLSETFGGLSDELIAMDTSRGFWASLVDKSAIGYVDEFTNTVRVMQQELSISEGQAVSVADSLRNFGEASTLEDQVAAAVELGIAFEEVFGGIQNIPDELKEVARQAGLLALQAAEVTGEITDADKHTGFLIASIEGAIDRGAELESQFGLATAEALRLAGVDLTSGISSATIEAANLAANLGIALDAAMSIQNMRSTLEYSGRGGDPRDFMEGGSGTYYQSELGYTSVSERIEAAQKATERAARSSSRGSSSGSSKKKAEEDYLKTLQEEIAYKTSLIGLSEQEVARAEFIQDLKENEVNLDDQRIGKLWEQQQALDAATKAEEVRIAKLESTKDQISDFLESVPYGFESIEDAFNDMLSNILMEIYQQQVISPVADFGANLLSGFIPQADGGIWSKGVQMYAKGDVFSSPTMFQHSGGLGVMGEAGPEAIMPLKRGADGKLGVATDGSSSGSQQISVTYQIVGNGDEYIMEQISKSAPQIVKAAESSILQSRKRGGKFKSTFK